MQVQTQVESKHCELSLPTTPLVSSLILKFQKCFSQQSIYPSVLVFLLLCLPMPLSSNFIQRLLKHLPSVPAHLSHCTSTLRFMCPYCINTCISSRCLKVNMLPIKSIVFLPQYYFFYLFFSSLPKPCAFKNLCIASKLVKVEIDMKNEDWLNGIILAIIEFVAHDR